MLKFTQIILVLALFSCASTDYHPAMSLSQKEISESRLISGNKFSAGKVYDFGGIYPGESKQNCRTISCKNVLEEVTGLRCESFCPKDPGGSDIVTNATLEKSK